MAEWVSIITKQTCEVSQSRNASYSHGDDDSNTPHDLFTFIQHLLFESDLSIHGGKTIGELWELLDGGELLMLNHG
jgi:hypothetical protein